METAATDSPSKDPFNWPMPNRDQLMSLSSINFNQDNMIAKKKNGVFTKRTES